MYEVKTEKYCGPLEKLLALIEERKLEVTTVNLGAVTGDFIEYVKSIEEHSHARILSDFIVVASRLMLIKSKVLLPQMPLSEEEEHDIRDLEERLKIYKEFKSAGALLRDNFKTLPQSFSRPLLAGAQAIFYPAASITVQNLHYSIENLFKTLETFAPKEERLVKRALVTIEEKMREVIGRLTSGIKSFKALASGGGREEVVILFLALLHLIKQQHFAISQAGQFDDIIITPK